MKLLVHLAGDRNAWGYIPMFLTRDHGTAKELINDGYVGGWRPFKGFKLQIERASKTAMPVFHLTYPGDPELRVRAVGKFGDETLVLFESDWLAIIQPNDQWEIARID